MGQWHKSMHQSHISQCTILQQKCAHACTFLLQNGALWNMCLKYFLCCGILDGSIANRVLSNHDDVMKWKHFRVTGHLCGEFTGHRWISRTKASDAELWCFLWINDWLNNREAGDLRRNRAHYDVTVMWYMSLSMHFDQSHGVDGDCV